MNKIFLGAGCFWGVQHYLDKLEFVQSTRVGYMNGDIENPTYEEVCTGTSGHVEVVEVDYQDSDKNLNEILSLFWRLHDPTQLNRQGYDKGTQYKSAIIYQSEAQKIIAIDSKEKFDKTEVFKDKAVTVIENARTFWPAEDYHQDYFQKNASNAICHALRDK